GERARLRAEVPRAAAEAVREEDDRPRPVDLHVEPRLVVHGSPSYAAGRTEASVVGAGGSGSVCGSYHIARERAPIDATAANGVGVAHRHAVGTAGGGWNASKALDGDRARRERRTRARRDRRR